MLMRSEPQGVPGQYNQVMTWIHFLPVTDILVWMTYTLTWASFSPSQLAWCPALLTGDMA